MWIRLLQPSNGSIYQKYLVFVCLRKNNSKFQGNLKFELSVLSSTRMSQVLFQSEMFLFANNRKPVSGDLKQEFIPLK